MDNSFVRLPGKYSRYAINPNGIVFDLVENVVLSHTKGPRTPYIGVSLIADGETRTKTVSLHRLIAMAFVPNNTGLPIESLQVNHIDGIKINNSPCNLEWVTHQQNCQHAYRTGLRKDNILIQIVSRTGETQFFYSQAEAARFFGVHPASLHEHMNTERRRYHPFRGYYVSYCDDRFLGEREDENQQPF